ncbi:MAG: translation initiation factor IF-2 associated domain-containing protein, partial [Xanthobacteraceae bacterium]
MTETTKNTGEKLSVSSTKTLTLKRGGVEQGVVRQSFSHGRSKAVVVEKVKRRTAAPTEAKTEAGTPQERGAVLRRPATGRTPAAVEAAPSMVPAQPKTAGVVLRTLTDEEQSARAHALADARVREAMEREVAEQTERERRQRDEKDRFDRAAADQRKRGEEDRRKQEEDAKRKADELAKKRFGAETVLAKPGSARVNVEEEDEAPRPRRGI